MSIENAKAFYTRMNEDESFRNQYQNATTSEARRELVLAAGYNFTPAEWEAAMKEILEPSSEELSDEELTAVSGGLVIPPRFPTPLYGGPRPFPIDPTDLF